MSLLTDYQLILREKILRLQASSKKDLEERGVIPDELLFNEILSPGTDQRYGVNLIARPSRQVIDYIITLQNYLRNAEIDQYYYPSDDLHLTMLEIWSSCSWDYANETAVNSLQAMTDEFVSKLPSPRIVSPLLVYDNRACALNFVPVDRSLEHVRTTLAERLLRNNVQLAPRYSAQTAHITFMRYIVPLRTKLEKWLTILSNVPVQDELKWDIDSIWLTWGRTWYGMRSLIQEAGPYRLLLPVTEKPI